MADVKWIKITTDVFDDEKILLIDGMPESDAIIVIWFKLLCMAGKQNNGGVFMMNDKIAYNDEMLSTIFRRPLNTVRLALNTFEKFGMIEIVNNAITIPNWNKHQSLDKLEQAREKNRKRIAKYRSKQKALAEGKTDSTENSPADSNANSNVTVTESNADRIRKEKEKEKEKEREGEVVKTDADAPDYDDPDDKLKVFKGNVVLSENQIADLLEKLDLEMFNVYLDRLDKWLEKTGATGINHYETILTWYNQDRAVKV